MGIRYEFIPSGYAGAALAVAFYIILAKNAIPTGLQILLSMTVTIGRMIAHGPCRQPRLKHHLTF
jgi:hypothetical protein